jgi:putrescine importer
METTTTAVASTTAHAPRLHRALSLWDLILYGIIIIQPTAPMPAYGVFAAAGKGHVVTCILIGMVAMAFTAFGYGRMARVYPSAGSAYTYVGREIHPAAGYFTGWSVVMGYMLNPVICTIWCAKAITDLLHGTPLAVPYPGLVWPVFFAVLFTILNLRGIETSARINQIMCSVMGAMILAFFWTAVRYIFHIPQYPQSYFLHPFFNPETFTVGTVFRGTSLAVLTYIGFDAISTLSEEVKNPERNILLATVLVCLITGALAGSEAYGAQLLSYHKHGREFGVTDLWKFGDENVFAHVAGIAGGIVMTRLISITLLIATIGSGMGSQLGAARLLYGMGRSNAIPKKFFSAIHPKTRIPANNVMFVGAVALAGAFLFDLRGHGYEIGAALLNFGALIAFMGVNAAALTHYYIRGRDRSLGQLLPPVLGFAICLFIWVKLPPRILLAGAIWMALGLIYGARKTKGFRSDLVNFDIPPEE